MLRAMGWDFDEKTNAVIDSKRKSAGGEARDGGTPYKQK